MAAFDAPNREVCALKRPRSNTPLQALVTLNDPVYVEAARALGRRMAESPGSTAMRLSYGFELCLARLPSESELKRLEDFHAAALKHFDSRDEAARQMAGSGTDAKLGAPEAREKAAWTAVANVLLNLDEFLMKP
jgi:hypothetical protein